MKKLLIAAALSFSIVGPAMAVEVVRVPYAEWGEKERRVVIFLTQQSRKSSKTSLDFVYPGSFIQYRDGGGPVLCNVKTNGHISIVAINIFATEGDENWTEAVARFC